MANKVIDTIKGKYERNPTVHRREAKKRLDMLEKRKMWATKGMYPDTGQILIDKFTKKRREVGKGKGKERW